MFKDSTSTNKQHLLDTFKVCQTSLLDVTSLNMIKTLERKFSQVSATVTSFILEVRFPLNLRLPTSSISRFRRH